ncbi:MAG: hypothetical protein JO329_03470 [Planctomycetaceae bacterium]|nr:hypothetical protein [Planctomycetaceae bacterium]
MIKALAPRIPRGFSWVWVSIVLVVGSLRAIDAREPTKARPSADAAKAKLEAPADATDKAEPDASAAEAPEAAEPETPPKASTVEIFKDPRAERALTIYAPLPGSTPNNSLIRSVKAMASKQIGPDRSQIQGYVNGYAADLTSRTNIRAVIDPPPSYPPASAMMKAIEHATDGLIDPILTAKQINNTDFLQDYNQALLATLPKLLNNHLLARIEAMIVLAQTGSTDFIDLFIGQLKDVNQIVWVKLWAAKGLTNLVQNGQRTDELGARAIPAAEALADFLEKERKMPWPVQVRALEALGAMRLAAVPATRDEAKMVSAAVDHLTDPQAKAEVRAQAAWAVGMLRDLQGITKFNFPLVAYHVGEVAADVGDQVAKAYPTNRYLGEYWTGVLLYQVYPSLFGQPGAHDSGMLNVPNRPSFVKQVADLVQPIAKGALDLTRAPTGQQRQLEKELSDRVAQLRTFLEKNPPRDRHLIPGGDEYPVMKGPVASEAGQEAQVTGGQ